MNRFPIQTALTIALLGALLVALPRVVPAIKGPRLKQLIAVADFDPERTVMTPLRPHPPNEVERPLYLKPKEVETIFDDSDGVLDKFYAALWRTERHEPGAITRIAHYGDSPTTADLITGDIRVQLQARYGSAGHGFTLLAKPWAWYRHRGILLTGSGWQILPVTNFELKRDGFYGLGGVSFTAGAPAHAGIKLEDGGQSNFELYYLQQPEGGSVSVAANGQPVAQISTKADVKSPGFAAFNVPGGASQIDLWSTGQVRLFGLTAEKSGPGVVYDSLGVNGASVNVLARMFNPEHWAAELLQRNPNLVVINYGTNEADDDSFVDHAYEKQLREAIRRVRAAVTTAAILVMSPMDRGYRTGPGEIETMATIPRIVGIQRRVAKETGCGFFDTFDAMGGTGTMARWYNGEPRLVYADLIHPYPAGGKIIATIFTREIEAGLSGFKLRQLSKPSTSSEVR